MGIGEADGCTQVKDKQDYDHDHDHDHDHHDHGHGLDKLQPPLFAVLPDRGSGGEREFASHAADALESASVLRSLARDAPPQPLRSYSQESGASSEWTVVDPAPLQQYRPPPAQVCPAISPMSICQR